MRVRPLYAALYYPHNKTAFYIEWVDSSDWACYEKRNNFTGLTFLSDNGTLYFINGENVNAVEYDLRQFDLDVKDLLEH